MFETLDDCGGVTTQWDRWVGAPAPAAALALLVAALAKLLTETASDAAVARCLLPHVARLVGFGPNYTFIWVSLTNIMFLHINSIKCSTHPYYLMSAAALGCALPFHLVTGTPANAMVAAYVHIHPWTMMYAGAGPSLMSVLVIWFTVTTWSKAVWTDINVFPNWARNNVFNITS